MFRCLIGTPPPRSPFVCLFCAAKPNTRLVSATSVRYKTSAASDKDGESTEEAPPLDAAPPKEVKQRKRKEALKTPKATMTLKQKKALKTPKATRTLKQKKALDIPIPTDEPGTVSSAVDLLSSLTARLAMHRVPGRKRGTLGTETNSKFTQSIKEAMQGVSLKEKSTEVEEGKGKEEEEAMCLEQDNEWNAIVGEVPTRKLSAEALYFQPIDVDIPPIPKLAHNLDRVLFNSGVYRLQDPRSRIYNFDPYLEKIMPVGEFDFDALSAYQTSSKDGKLLAMTEQVGAKFTGSTSSMSGILQHFHYLLSSWRGLNMNSLSRQFPNPSVKFTKITTGPQAIFLRWKNGTYAIDADKEYDSPNVMSWLGQSLEKLLTNTREEFERYRRSNPEQAPSEVESGKSYHYSKLGNFLVRSQLDAHDSRLPGTGVFDLKTRAVLAIRMNHREYENGAGYQLRYEHGEWESFERELYDMARATMLKYSLQVRMGRMDGIFVAYHNVERIFGFQYLSLSDMDLILHGQTDTSLGDKEFTMSISLLDEILQRAIAKYPQTSLRLHFETGLGEYPVMSIFAEPVTEDQVEEIQLTAAAATTEFEQRLIKGIQEGGTASTLEEKSKDELIAIIEKLEEEASDSDPESIEEMESEETIESKKIPDAPRSDTEKAVMGWTLTSRNLVNGEAVKRPDGLGPSDDYSIEYLIQDIAEDKCKELYSKLKQRRKVQFDRVNKVDDAQWKLYLAKINSYTEMGRAWRDEQDAIHGKTEKQVYQPLGPGSESVIHGKIEKQVC